MRLDLLLMRELTRVQQAGTSQVIVSPRRQENVLIRHERQQRGTIDHTPVYPREVVKRALELGAAALILLHNHPSGDPTPSKADITVIQDIKKAAAPLGVVLHDHLIIGHNSHTSLRDLKLI